MPKFDLAGVKETLRKHNFPVDVIIEVISYCNLNCVMCPQASLTRPRGEMAWSTFKRIVDEVAVTNPETRLWLAIMGEPLLLGNRLVSMVEYAKGKGVRQVKLNTNANLLSPEMSRNLIVAGVQEILVGMDACSEKTYKSIRRGGNFHKVVENIETLLKIREESGRDQTQIVMQFIVMDENADEAEDFKRHWLGKGAVVKIRPKLGWGTGVKADNLNLPQSERNFPCPWLMRTVSIHWDGNFAQCDGDYDGKHSPGNIFEQSIQEVWDGELAERRKKHWNGDFSHPLCEVCKDWQAGRSQFFYPQKP